ncbi:MAG: hypothetical protein IPJ04_00515 [Candidatus Eisenbacteria bacterium]|nr:hypothetical protein [Candidatus Eisenbacteria bacterium]
MVGTVVALPFWMAFAGIAYGRTGTSTGTDIEGDDGGPKMVVDVIVAPPATGTQNRCRSLSPRVRLRAALVTNRSR